MDNDTRRKKQQELMTELIERKIRLHAQHLYDQRGQEEGLALQDWVEAESRVLENSILAPLYRKSRGENPEPAGDLEDSPDAAICRRRAVRFRGRRVKSGGASRYSNLSSSRGATGKSRPSKPARHFA